MSNGIPADDELPVAFCAPGRTAIVMLALALHGECVSRITETRMLEGSTDVFLVRPDLLRSVLNKAEFPVMPPRPAPDWLAFPYCLLPPPRTILTSVI